MSALRLPCDYKVKFVGLGSPFGFAFVDSDFGIPERKPAFGVACLRVAEGKDEAVKVLERNFANILNAELVSPYITPSKSDSPIVTNFPILFFFDTRLYEVKPFLFKR